MQCGIGRLAESSIFWNVCQSKEPARSSVAASALNMPMQSKGTLPRSWEIGRMMVHPGLIYSPTKSAAVLFLSVPLNGGVAAGDADPSF
jgi:hypothetical protein